MDEWTNNTCVIVVEQVGYSSNDTWRPADGFVDRFVREGAGLKGYLMIKLEKTLFKDFGMHMCYVYVQWKNKVGDYVDIGVNAQFGGDGIPVIVTEELEVPLTLYPDEFRVQYVSEGDRSAKDVGPYQQDKRRVILKVVVPSCKEGVRRADDDEEEEVVEVEEEGL